MSVKNLSTTEMIELTARCLDPRGHRAAFRAVPLMAGFLARLAEAHAAFVAEGCASPAARCAPSAAADEASARAFEADRAHDRKGAGVLAALDACEALAATPAEAAGYAALRARLFPAGDHAFAESYSAEAANARRVAAELDGDAELRARLAAIPLPGGRTLLDEARAFADAGAALAAATSAPPPGRAEPCTCGASARARGAWARAVDAMLAAAGLLSGAEAERFAPVLRDFRGAEARADARALARLQHGDDDADWHA